MTDRVQGDALIRLKRVRKIERHLGGVPEGAEFRLLVRVQRRIQRLAPLFHMRQKRGEPVPARVADRIVP